MVELFPFFIVLFAGIFFSELFNRLHLPWVVALILGGIAIGPSGLDIYTPSSAVTFIGNIGLIFLLFMAGLEVRLKDFSEGIRGISLLPFLNAFIPGIVGALLGLAYGLDVTSSLFLGVIFISSSIAIVVPVLETTKLISKRVGKSIIASTLLQDIIGIGLLSLFLQANTPTSTLPLPLFYVLTLIVLVSLRFFVPKVLWFFREETKRHPEDLFQQELRAVFVLFIGIVICFELLGLHPIVAGFAAGIILSDSITSKFLLDKLRTLSYGLFIPVFFILMGIQSDLRALSESAEFLVVTLAIILASLSSKYLSGYFGGRLTGFSQLESSFIGSASMAHLVTPLAAAFAGLELGLFPIEIVTAIVVLSLISTLLVPIVVSRIAEKIVRKQEDIITSTLNSPLDG